MQEFEDLEEDVNNLGDDCTQPHLTKEDYEKSLNTEQSSVEDNNLNGANDPAYQVMAELQHKYNLRPRNKLCRLCNPRRFCLGAKHTSPSRKRPRCEIT